MQESGTPPFPQGPEHQAPETPAYPSYPAYPAYPTSPSQGEGTVPATIPAQPPVQQSPYPSRYGYEAGTPWPPYGGAQPPYTPVSQPRRRPWRVILLALAQVAVLVIGIVIGAFVFSSRSSSAHTLTIGAQSAPAITQSSSISTLQKQWRMSRQPWSHRWSRSRASEADRRQSALAISERLTATS